MKAAEVPIAGPRALFLGGAAGIILGSLWDVSWDSSIGVHSFSSPPHLTVNLGGLAVAIAGILVLPRCRTAGILALAGAALMAVAEVVALFRGAPPILADGWTAIQIVAVAGMALAVLAGVAHAASLEDESAALDRPIATGMLLALAATALGAYSLPNLQRTALFHQLSAAVYPAVLVVALRLGHGAWPATAAAAVYTLVVASLVWLLPLFPATPASQPVFEPVTHMLPPRFPLLLLGPALGFDLLRRGLARRELLQVPILGVAFVALFVPVQWFFSAFLLAPASDHWFFAGGGEHWPFFVEIGAERAMFWGLEQSPLDAAALAWAVGFAVVSAAAGWAVAAVLRR